MNCIVTLLRSRNDVLGLSTASAEEMLHVLQYLSVRIAKLNLTLPESRKKFG